MEDNKPYSIEIECTGEILHVAVGGIRVTEAIALSYWQEINDECEAKNCSKILLEHNFIEMISMKEMLDVIGPVEKILKGKVLAFYDRHGNYDIPEAGKAILRSHDVKMQIFQDLERAEHWLLAN